MAELRPSHTLPHMPAMSEPHAVPGGAEGEPQKTPLPIPGSVQHGNLKAPSAQPDKTFWAMVFMVCMRGCGMDGDLLRVINCRSYSSLILST